MCVVDLNVQLNFNESKTDGSFTMADSFSCPNEFLPFAPDKRYALKAGICSKEEHILSF